MFLLRHGQSLFNLHFTETRRDPGIEDPELTPLGMAQAQAAAALLAAEAVTRVIISPYTRALQTAAPVLAVHDGAAVSIMQEVRERAAFVCDIGSPAAVLAARFPRHDFSHLPETWWPGEIESEAATIDRANAFRAAMAGRDDHETTVLVSHWAFILALTGVSVNNGEVTRYDPRQAAPRRIIWRP